MSLFQPFLGASHRFRQSADKEALHPHLQVMMMMIMLKMMMVVRHLHHHHLILHSEVLTDEIPKNTPKLREEVEMFFSS